MRKVAEGKKISSRILKRLKPRIERLKKEGLKPALGAVIVGEDKPSQNYVMMKGRAAQKIGLEFFKFEYPKDIKKEDLIKEIQKIQAENDLRGLIVQLPLPEDLKPFTREIVNEIKLDIDVDCLTYTALGRVMMRESLIEPPTPGAIMEILRHYRISLMNKVVCLVGRGDLIGKPLAAMLAHEPITLITCDIYTPILSVYTQEADIIITGVGKKDLITGNMIKEGAVVIDGGVSFENRKIYGDTHFDSVREKASLLTSTPGGVGPITVAKLLENTVKSAEALLNNQETNSNFQTDSKIQ